MIDDKDLPEMCFMICGTCSALPCGVVVNLDRYFAWLC
jgi:hypothetical protein